MPEDACNAVKSDLKAGTYTRFRNAFPIYIEKEDDYQGGNEFIMLKNPYREPVQTVDGSVLFTKRGCVIEIKANSTKVKDDLYDDVIDILTATSRGYKIEKGRDLPISQIQTRISLNVSFLL